MSASIRARSWSFEEETRMSRFSGSLRLLHALGRHDKRAVGVEARRLADLASGVRGHHVGVAVQFFPLKLHGDGLEDRPSQIEHKG